jgi:chorismate--pyruvate lyase
LSTRYTDTVWQRRPVVAWRYRPWLRDRGSLTARIKARCSAFSVRVIFQGLRRANRDERFLVACGKRVLVREVVLYCGATPVVFAHTVLDAASLKGAWRSVARLGTRPLGAALFADPRVARFPLRQKKLAPHHELHRRIRALFPHVAHGLWARRSLFQLHNSPILVTEVFLPEILKL